MRKAFAQHTGAYRRVCRLLVCVLALSLLAGCTTGTVVTLEEQLPGAGGVVPEVAVEGFFADLNEALADRRLLASDSARARWAEQLAGYFAPVERQRQRAALGRMLDEFAASVRQEAQKAAPGEQIQVVLEVRPQPIDARIVARQEVRALAQLPDAALYVQIASLREGRQEVTYRQSEPLARLLGRPDGSIPLVRVDGRWFLSST